MTLNTIQWIYQRVSTPLIIILSFWLFITAYQIRNYNYETIYIFFSNKNNLLLFLIFVILSLFHTSVEIFHSINDYFDKSKNEKFINNFVLVLYVLVFLSLLIFIARFAFI